MRTGKIAAIPAELDVPEILTIFDKDITERNCLEVARKINVYKANFTNTFGIKLDLDEERQRYLPKIAHMAALYDRSARHEMNTLVSLSHIIDSHNLRDSIQHETLTQIIKDQSLQGLRWFLAIDFDPSSKNSEGINVLEHLAEIAPNTTSRTHLDMAKMLIGAKKSTASLLAERSPLLRIRTKEGKDLEGLEGNLSDLVIFGLEQNIIRLSEFRPSRGADGRIMRHHSFEETLGNIFSNEDRTNNLLRQFNARSRVKIKKEHLPRNLSTSELVEDNFVRPFDSDDDDHTLSPMHGLGLRQRKSNYHEVMPSSSTHRDDKNEERKPLLSDSRNATKHAVMPSSSVTHRDDKDEELEPLLSGSRSRNTPKKDKGCNIM